MEQILAAIESEIKTEVLKQDIDLPKLKSLVDLALHVKNISIESISQIPTESGALQRGVSPVRAIPYIPSVPSLERLISEIMPSLIPMLEMKFQNDAILALATLTERYSALEGKDPELAKKLRGKIEEMLEKKEVKNENKT